MIEVNLQLCCQSPFNGRNGDRQVDLANQDSHPLPYASPVRKPARWKRSFLFLEENSSGMSQSIGFLAVA